MYKKFSSCELRTKTKTAPKGAAFTIHATSFGDQAALVAFLTLSTACFDADVIFD